RDRLGHRRRPPAVPVRQRVGHRRAAQGHGGPALGADPAGLRHGRADAPRSRHQADHGRIRGPLRRHRSLAPQSPIFGSPLQAIITMRILHVSSECGPWAKTGGLGDVVGALPDALWRAEPGNEAAAVLPSYRAVKAALAKRNLPPVDTGIVADVNLGATTARVRFLRLDQPNRAPTFFAANDPAYDREGLYGHDDDALRFILLCKATVGVGSRLLGGPPDIIHAHDWHAALIPGLVATNARVLLPRTRTVLTLHNLAYQGICSKDTLPITGLPWEVFNLDAFEWYDHMNLLKGGIACADAVTTVSPTYAREIKTPEFGANLDGFLRRQRIFGILNGIDIDEWNPGSDPNLAAHCDLERLDKKREVRADLLRICDWPELPDVPLFGVV